MKRDRVYFPQNNSLPFGPEDDYVVQRLMAVLESSFDGIFLTDSQAKPVWCNHSYEVISGLSREEVLGIPMGELVKKGIISRSATLMALEQGQAVTIEQSFHSGKRAIVTSTPIYDGENHVSMVVTNVRDISELITLQETVEKQRALSARYAQEIAQVRDQLMDMPQMIAEDPSTLDLLRIVNRAAQLDTVVLIQGESGAGKEFVASYIHRCSPRSGKPFIRVNCGAIPENLAESEFFGYERGAFTGANREGKAGLFEAADQGTIFLDEVGELPPSIQTKLLRVLQERELTRVGGNKPIQVNVRVIAATNRDLQNCVKAGTFREDLYYRLSVFPVVVPPLRERKLDIIHLAQATVRELNQRYGRTTFLTAGAEAVLLQYDWPGNIRELRNVMERAFIMSNGEEIQAEDLSIMDPGTSYTPAGILPSSEPGEHDGPDPGKAPLTFSGTESLQARVEKYEAGLILQAMTQTESLRKAARLLRMDPATLLRRKKKYENMGLLPRE